MAEQRRVLGLEECREPLSQNLPAGLVRIEDARQESSERKGAERQVPIGVQGGLL